MDTVDDIMKWHFSKSCPPNMLPMMNSRSMDRPRAPHVHKYRGLSFMKNRCLISAVSIGGTAYDKTFSSRLRISLPSSYVGATDMLTDSWVLDAHGPTKLTPQINNNKRNDIIHGLSGPGHRHGGVVADACSG